MVLSLMLQSLQMKINSYNKENQMITHQKPYKNIQNQLEPLKFNLYFNDCLYNIYQVIKKTEDDIKGFGGVLLTSEDGLIICKNTLDVRTDICFQDSLPDIRRELFGK